MDLIFSQSRQVQVPKQSETDKKHFEPKFIEKDKELKKLKLEKVDLKKKNALLTKQTKEIKREIEDLEKRKGLSKNSRQEIDNLLLFEILL